MRISTRISNLLESQRLHRRARVAVGVRGWKTWLVVAALAGVGLAATVDVLRGGKDAAPPAARQPATAAEKNTAEEVAMAPTPAGLDLIEAPLGPRSAVTEEGVTFSFRSPEDGWLGRVP